MDYLTLLGAIFAVSIVGAWIGRKLGSLEDRVTNLEYQLAVDEDDEEEVYKH